MKIENFIEIELTEKVAESLGCDNGCQRSQGSPTGG